MAKIKTYGLPTYEEIENLKPYKEFPNKDYYQGYKNGMPEGAKHVLYKAIPLLEKKNNQIKKLKAEIKKFKLDIKYEESFCSCHFRSRAYSKDGVSMCGNCNKPIR